MLNVFATLQINHFESDVIREPREVTYSVRGLNDEPLNRLVAKFQKLVKGSPPRTPVTAEKVQLVVSPAAGYGKSHLLGRLFQELENEATQVYLLPFQDPDRSWQSILLITAQELDRPSQHNPQGVTQLEAFALGVLAHIAADHMENGAASNRDRLQDAIKHLREHPLDVFDKNRENRRFIEWIKARLDNPHDLSQLAQLLRARNIALFGREKAWLQVLAGYAFSTSGSMERDAALTWIRGEPLENEQIQVLKLVASDNDGAVEASAAQINDISFRRLHGLCALSSCYRPFLFCFDQTEVYGSDKGLVDALGRCAWRLHTQVPNHMTVATVNSLVWADYIHPNLRPADRDRFSNEILLQGIDQEQGRQLIAQRLCDFRLSGDALSRVLETDWLAEQFRMGPFLGVRTLLARAAARFGELGRPGPEPPPTLLENTFAAEVNKVRAKPALHQYNQDCLMWFAQVLSEGFDGVKIKKSGNRYFSTQWELKDRSVYFAFEGGDNNGRWRAMAKEAVDLAAGNNKCAVVFRTPDLKPVPGPRWQAARRTIDEACKKGLRIERFTLDEVCELHAAREFYSNALQGNVEFTPADVLAWLKTRFHPWFKKYSAVTEQQPAKPSAEPPQSPKPPGRKSPTAKTLAPQTAPTPARLSDSHLAQVVDHMKKRLLADINEVLKVLGSATLRDALLIEVEKHPNLKAHPGPQTIYLQWRIA